MKVSAATSSAMPCAASSTVPIQPIISAEAWNIPPSASPVSPIGTHPPDLPHRDPIRPPEPLEQVKAAQVGREMRVDPQRPQGHHLRRDGRHGGTLRPKFGEAPVAEDQDPVDRMFSPTAASVTHQHRLRAAKTPRDSFAAR
jgi:hypothetical protein